MLQKLRSKPDHIKKSISLILTIIIFSVILFVWISSWDARLRGDEIRDKTVSPMIGVTSMFDGLTSGFNEKMPNDPSFIEINNTATDTQLVVATSTDSLGLSGVVVLDPSATTTE